MITQWLLELLMFVAVQPLRLLPNVETLENLGGEHWIAALPLVGLFFSYVDLFIDLGLVISAALGMMVIHFVIWGVNQTTRIIELIR